MAIDVDAPHPDVLAFLAERHLASLVTLRPDGTPHVVPVGFSYDADRRLVRIITARSSRKVANIVAGADESGAGASVAVTQIDGGRWLTLEGTATVTDEDARVAEAERRYGERYQAPRPRDDRVAIEIRVTRMLGRA
ncbi:MAG: TIGR03618 family F420-dependent PPOX class oxidoreductase [Acidimicrobiales bacterium]|nr:TIGR03618 family F420-dependent PPOX class oxidoreductase [Acidimicrobiales bacterium]